MGFSLRSMLLDSGGSLQESPDTNMINLAKSLINEQHESCGCQSSVAYLHYGEFVALSKYKDPARKEKRWIWYFNLLCI